MENIIYIVDNSVLVPGVPRERIFKQNVEAILVTEPEEKRRYAIKVSRGKRGGQRYAMNATHQEQYGRRYASPSKASLKKRNKKR